jgi:hypothetical protein
MTYYPHGVSIINNSWFIKVILKILIVKILLSRYVAKNDILFYHLPWHCLRDVSRLFTSINFEKDESARYFEKLPSGPENQKPPDQLN